MAAWLAACADTSSGLHQRLRQAYGDEAEIVAEKAQQLAAAVTRCAALLGDDGPVIVVRAPGRINLLGMHIDHRGGAVNPIAVNELLLIAQPRDDDTVVLHNTQEQFGPRQFAIGDLLPAHPIDDWDRWTQAEYEQRKEAGLGADWANYVKAPLVYLQHLQQAELRQPAQRLRGFNSLVTSTLGIAAGLSSSSALVVATMLAAVAINHLPHTSEELVELCGAAEWYVGTRGGAGDHAAILLSRQGCLSHLGNHPLTVQTVPLPGDYDIVVADSLKQAQKTAGARDTFNARVAAYEFGLALLKRNYPDRADEMARLRDVSPARLGVSEAEVMRMIRSLPESITRAELLQSLPDERGMLEKVFATHNEPPAGYRVRQVCLFGIAECLRSEMVPALLASGDIDGFGRLMTISHDGDRVTRLANGRCVPFSSDASDATLDRLIADSESGDADRTEAARLYRQPGEYECSCEELDELVDHALANPGVVGARLIGAGLGGSVAVLVAQAETDSLLANLTEQYYRPRGLPAAVEVCKPVGGASLLAL